MQGVALCARCGLERSSTEPTPHRRTRRAVLLGLLSSGFLAKMALGAAALAAVGGIAVTLPTADPPPEPATTVTDTSTPVEMPGAQITTGRDSGSDIARLAEEFTGKVKDWGKCVSEEASAHSEGPFDPRDKCGEVPHPADFGLGTAHAPGLNKVENGDSDGKVLPASARSGDEKIDNPNKPDQTDRPANPNKPDQTDKPVRDSDD